MHFWIPLPFFNYGGTGRGDQDGVHERALTHRHTPRTLVGFDGLKDLLAQLVLLQQVAESEDRGLIRDPIADQLDAGKAPHRGYLDHVLFHDWITERVPLLQQVNAQHLRKRIRRSAAFLARLGVVGLDQSDQRWPRHDHLNHGEKLLALGLLHRCGQLVIREAELLANNYPSPGLRLQATVAWIAWVSQRLAM